MTDVDNTPHYGEVVGTGDARRIRLASNKSDTFFAENIWLWWDKELSGGSRTIRITPDTRISFAEAGEIFGAQDSGPGWGHDNCGILVCGVYFALSDTDGNVLIYRLQRPTDASESTSANRAELFIEPEDGVYSRNLYDDFSRIPNFDPSNAAIQYMQLEVNPWDESTEELGWATIDDIKIFDEAE